MVKYSYEKIMEVYCNGSRKKINLVKVKGIIHFQTPRGPGNPGKNAEWTLFKYYSLHYFPGVKGPEFQVTSS